jgi:predicted nucleotidyltransferase component of viral defense system
VKELIRHEVAKVTPPQLQRLALAEVLQHLILHSLYRHGAFRHLIFTGGTALRILYHTNRYSEDLDFSLGRARGFAFRALLEKMQRDLALQQLPCEVVPQGRATVAKADLRFPGLLHEFGLSPLKGHQLTVKVEVDRRPPAGGVKEIALVTSPVSYTVTTFDLPSLFATKLHAIFFRGHVKGRDYYDLVWFLGRGVQPNFRLLNHAIRQTEGAGHDLRQDDFKRRLTQHLEAVDLKRIRAEVERFVLNREEVKLLTLDAITSLLRQYP